MTFAVITQILVIFSLGKVNFVPWQNEIKTISIAIFSLLLTITRNTPEDTIINFYALSIHIHIYMCLYISQHVTLVR